MKEWDTQQVCLRRAVRNSKDLPPFLRLRTGEKMSVNGTSEKSDPGSALPFGASARWAMKTLAMLGTDFQGKQPPNLRGCAHHGHRRAEAAGPPLWSEERPGKLYRLTGVGYRAVPPPSQTGASAGSEAMHNP
jgi:hypothetical protein